MNVKPTPDTDGGAPRFEVFVRVRFHEVDALGHVNNAAFLTYMEQAAIDHASFLGLGMEKSRALGGVFVARRHEVLFVQPAFANDLLRVETWLDQPTGARIDRNYRIFRVQHPPKDIPLAGRPTREGNQLTEDDALLVEATTEWVFVSEQGRPRRIPAEMMDLFAQRTADVSAGQ